MPVETEITASTYTPIHAPRGNSISCKSWQQEAAMRMLMNNLDEEVAERPRDLVVYGGTGRAARSWEAYHAIVASLKSLENDETLLVQSGKPVGVFKTHEYAPRVLSALGSCLLPFGVWLKRLPDCLLTPRGPWHGLRRVESEDSESGIGPILFWQPAPGLGPPRSAQREKTGDCSFAQTVRRDSLCRDRSPNGVA
jgi:hypothetical protein